MYNKIPRPLLHREISSQTQRCALPSLLMVMKLIYASEEIE